MLNFGASKPRVRGGPGPRGPPWIRTWYPPSTHPYPILYPPSTHPYAILYPPSTHPYPILSLSSVLHNALKGLITLKWFYWRLRTSQLRKKTIVNSIVAPFEYFVSSAVLWIHYQRYSFIFKQYTKSLVPFLCDFRFTRILGFQE